LRRQYAKTYGVGAVARRGMMYAHGLAAVRIGDDRKNFIPVAIPFI
jgi:hypothetical protein